MSFDIVRAVASPVELRAVDDGLGTLEGHFSVFDHWYDVRSLWEGEFLERVAPGAFAKTIAEDRDAMRVMFEHGHDPQIGSKVLGSIAELAEDDIGARYSVDLFDTSYNRDLLPGLKAGSYGASFRFQVTGETWERKPERSDDNPDGLPERTITEAKVMEFGPVVFGANPAATAGVRSLTDHYYEQLRKRDVGAFEAACRAAGRPIDVAVPPTNIAIQGNTAQSADALKIPAGKPDARSADSGTPDEPSGTDGPSPTLRARDRALRFSLRRTPPCL